jgi:hypothetical protein
MKGKTYKVHLTADEKKRLEDMVNTGVHPVREVTHARMQNPAYLNTESDFI